MTNSTYTDYPFTADGINFISRVVTNSPMGLQIATIPQSIFIQMNIQTLKQIIGDASLLTRNELLAELEKVNEGGTQAFILLDEGAI